MEDSPQPPRRKGLLDQELFPQVSDSPSSPEEEAPNSSIKDGGEGNILDDPMPLLFEKKTLDFVYFLSHLISCNLLVFLRRRVGERNLRLWVLCLNAGIITAGVDLSGGFANPLARLSPSPEPPQAAQTQPCGEGGLNSPYYGNPYAVRPCNPVGIQPYGGTLPGMATPGVVTPPQPLQPAQAPEGHGDPIALTYVLALLAIGWYQNGMAKEWGELPPGLLTLARGESRLGRFLNRYIIPKELHGFGFAWSFTQHRFYPSPWLPLGERFIHQRLEPAVVGVIGALLLFTQTSPVLGLWLIFSALSLTITEYSYYERGRTLYLDRRDARLEARTISELDEPLSETSPTQPETETALRDALPVQVSEELLGRRQRRRLMALVESEQAEPAQTQESTLAETLLKSQAVEKLKRQARNYLHGDEDGAP